MSINRVNASGNLTRDPEVSYTASNLAVLKFSLAINDRRKNSSTGEWEDYANFVNCTMFGSRAESVAKYLTKGSKIAIEGRLHFSAWESEGQKRSKLEIIVEEIELMTRPNGGFDTGTPDEQSGMNVTICDEDIPF